MENVSLEANIILTFCVYVPQWRARISFNS